MLIAIVFFLIISLTIVMGTGVPVIKQVKAANDAINTKESLFLAEAALEDAVYRVKSGFAVSSGETLALNGHTATIEIADVLGNKEITAVANRDGLIRNVEAKLTQGIGVAFNYGVQVGNGGFDLVGGSSIIGNVYSNGNITGDGGVSITGSATAANPPAVTVHQSNESPLPPPSSIVFGTANGTQDVAQSFQMSALGPLTNVEFYIKKSAAASNSTVRIVNDSSGSPGGTLIAQGVLADGQIGTSYGWVSVVLDTPPQLPIGTTYWVVLDRSNGSSYTLGANANTSYPNGQAKVGRHGSSWGTVPNLDGYFKIKFGGGTSIITGDNFDYLVIGGGGVGDAWAHTVEDSNIAGTLYCQSGSNNNGKNCNTSRPDPPPQNLPVSDSNIQTWKSDAEAGGVITGNYTVGWQGATLGPKKITGNLTVNGGGTLTLSGTVWVVGNVTVSNGGKVSLASSYGTNSGVLLSDGLVIISGGGLFSGSGQAGSYPLVITTSTCPNGPTCGETPALIMTGGAGAVVLNAQWGTLSMNGGTSARSLVGYKVRGDNGATINYDAGIANMSFSSGPSGGWEIVSWKEVE